MTIPQEIFQLVRYLKRVNQSSQREENMKLNPITEQKEHKKRDESVLTRKRSRP